MSNNNIKISVLCITFNHKDYISKCLNSMLMQKTDFPFEILVHDDASTDGTSQIVRKYAEEFPDIIKPYIEVSNRYSQGKSPIFPLFSKIKGKYVAYCEGDDSWTDINKLQQQADFLDSHSDYAACCHQTIKHNLYTGEESFFSSRNADSDITTESILDWDFKDRYVHLNTVLFRKEVLNHLPHYLLGKYPIGDMPFYVYLTTCGKVKFFDKVMSNYNYGTAGSWVDRGKNFNTYQFIMNRVNGWIRLYEDIDQCTGYLYHKSVIFNKRRYERQKMKTWIRFNIPLIYSIHKIIKQIFNMGGVDSDSVRLNGVCFNFFQFGLLPMLNPMVSFHDFRS